MGTSGLLFSAGHGVVVTLVAIAIASPHRSPQLPDLPTVAESGLAGFDVTSWYGLVARAGTPPEVLEKIRADVVEALASEDVKAKLVSLGLEPGGMSPADFERLIAAESRKWGDIVRRAGIKTQQ